VPCTEFTTWNPVLNIRVLQGKVSAEELLERTLRLTFIDRQKDYDHIEWEVLNQDGLLTYPDTMAAGMVVAMKLGYIDGTFPWRTFIINRMRGGVGVYGRANAPLGEGQGTLTLFGRNRNARGGTASGGRGSDSWKPGRGRAPAALPGKDITESGKVRKPRKIYAPTSDMEQQDLILSSESKPRIILAKSTSDAVKEMARRQGFKSGEILVESSGDHIERCLIPAGRCDAEHMQVLAERIGFVFFIDETHVLHWHSPVWDGDTRMGNRPVEHFRYGANPDILRIGIDADFTLPFASSITVAGAKPETRTGYVVKLDMNDERKVSATGSAIVKNVGWDKGKNAPPQAKQLVKPFKLPGLPTGFTSEVEESVKRKYIQQMLHGFQLTVNCVGNPKLLAGKLVTITGSGSIFMDGTWQIGEARHVIQNSDSIVYGTDLRLVMPAHAKTKKGKGTTKMGYVGAPGTNAERKVSHWGSGYVQNFPDYDSARQSVASKPDVFTGTSK